MFNHLKLIFKIEIEIDDNLKHLNSLLKKTIFYGFILSKLLSIWNNKKI